MEAKEHYGLHVTVKKALAINPSATIRALGQEILQLIDMKACEPIQQADLKPSKTRSIIPAVPFMKDKYKPDGAFDKFKARIAGGGNRMNPATMAHVEVSSPTVDIASVNTCLTVAAHKGYGASTTDIKAAYLNASLPDSVDVVLIFDKITAATLVNLRPEYKPYIRSDGTMLAQVKKALYGIPHAGQLWYTHLSNTLMKAGYEMLKSDKCVFKKISPSGTSYICVHVDDLLHVFSDPKLDDQLQATLTKAYKEVNHERGDKLNYLGMVLEFDRKNKSAIIKNPAYIRDILLVHNINGYAITPSDTNLLMEDNTSARVDQTKFASMLMKLMYLGKRSRPDILLPVIYLASRITMCNQNDTNKLIRVYKYLNSTQDKGLVLHADTIKLTCFVDASYATHPDARSHTGIILTIGSANCYSSVYNKSAKQKLVSRSSTEAELIALNESLPQIIWLRNLLEELGYPQRQPTTIFQDNKSTIIISNKGHSNKGNTKHMHVRYFYIKDKIDDKTVQLEHLPTELMLADFFTKPLMGTQFTQLRDKLLGNTCG